MTHKEAINIILRSVVIKFDTREQISEALKLMQEAMTKQIKAKPLNKTDEYDGEHGECPCCGIAVADYAEYNVCSKCGQAIDWSDENDR